MRFPLSSALLLLLALLTFGACNRNVVTDGAPPPATPAPGAAAPPVAPPAPTTPVREGGDFALVPSHAPTMTFEAAPPAPSRAAPSSAVLVSGAVSLAPELQGKVAPGDVLYVVVRAAEGGRPVGIKRIDRPQLPAVFTITEADNPMGGAPVSGKVSVRAKIDKDGDAMSTTSGDLEGIVEDVEAGASGVDVRIDREVAYE